jgi:hypothetical protein
MGGDFDALVDEHAERQTRLLREMGFTAAAGELNELRRAFSKHQRTVTDGVGRTDSDVE